METRRWLLLATIAAAACGGYSAPDSVVLGSSVYTQPLKGFDFKPLTRFYLDPKMENWQDGTQQISTDLPAAASTPFVNRMVAYGWTQVGAGLSNPPTSGVDVGVKFALVDNSYSYYYSYCGSYWYGWYGCWPSWGYAGTYSTGTVIAVMVDLRGGADANPPNVGLPTRTVLWVNANYAVMQGTAANQANLTSAINRAFDQSTYLAH